MVRTELEKNRIAGAIVGQANTLTAADAFIYSHGKFTDIGTLGGSFAEAIAVNNNGTVAGQSFVAGDAATHAFVYRSGKLTDIDPNNSLGGSAAVSVNDYGAIVVQGGLDLPSTEPFSGFLYSKGRLVDLNSLIDPNSGWSIDFAFQINNNGVIIGSGTLNGVVRSFVMTPTVPEL
jgi:probable HAF family extracellular repeat protein